VKKDLKEIRANKLRIDTILKGRRVLETTVKTYRQWLKSSNWDRLLFSEKWAEIFKFVGIDEKKKKAHEPVRQMSECLQGLGFETAVEKAEIIFDFYSALSDAVHNYLTDDEASCDYLPSAIHKKVFLCLEYLM